MEENIKKFNSKIKEVLDHATPGQMICQTTGKKINISQDDISLCKLLKIPLPKVMPRVRHQLAMAHNIPDELFKNKSALSGKEIITSIPPEMNLNVYDDNEWWSDKWNATDYGRDYNRSKNFFGQLHKLHREIPRPAKAQYSQTTNENSEWTVQGYQFKNCYYVYGGVKNEDVLYSVSPVKCRDSMEIFSSTECELCYEVLNSKTCHRSGFLDNCENCSDCYFGFDLKNCEKCFSCFNLRHSKYCFYNKQLSKQGYEEKIKQINLGSYKELVHWEKKFKMALDTDGVRKHLDNSDIENSTGNNIQECKNCQNCFNTSKTQDSKNIIFSNKVNHSLDIFGSLNVERSAFTLGINLYNVKFSFAVFDCSNIEYCENCYNIEYCFGCVGLRNKKYHILNKPYSKEEYWQTVDLIKTNMLKRGEYGQYIPFKYSLYPYNLSAASKFYPLNKELAEKQGSSWYTIKERQTINGINATDLVDNIKDVPNDILEKTIICNKTTKAYTIVENELNFYKKMNLPLPRTHPMYRRANQFKNLRTPQLFKHYCTKCNKVIKIQGNDAKTQKVKNVCKNCYQQIIENLSSC